MNPCQAGLGSEAACTFFWLPSIPCMEHVASRAIKREGFPCEPPPALRFLPKRPP